MNKDSLYRYLFDNVDVRGELVQLEESYQQIVNAHQYPPRLQLLLGELMAATSLLTATLKFKGDISVQLQSQGPVSLAVINGNNQQQLRGVARWSDTIADDASLSDLLPNGHMVITLTPVDGERYQGVVALDKASIAACLEGYFAQSEQLPTGIWLFADGKQAAGMLLQILPGQAAETGEFDHLQQLTATITADELFGLSAEQVLHRLYHQEHVRLFDPIPVSFKCTCSRERSAAAIMTLPKTELDEIIAEHGVVEMGCEFCNSQYRFDAVDVEALFNDAETAPVRQQ
ncbi:molecular chaperone Hsp33 [Shewanella mangrovi]|uniref:33 kDa chaperonin n=1 Tax=Shewanella mangrovi TaxID=1515746 RepID=A0A094LNB5_9GAMM|nr:Hsp33 family molecular chaperone HslO [Shewanella mangrovi]KFZ36623.1 molecular chaperone Hsp33 [Shewanella mangrovi]